MVMRPPPDAVVEEIAANMHQPRDPNTLSNYHVWKTKHTTANLEIDFDQKMLRGSVSMTLQKLQKQGKITLDTSYLNVSSVKIDDKEVKWDLAASRVEPYGSPLTIDIPSAHVESSSELTIDIEVSTTKDCTALQWMTPAQTGNKKHPYMFSQCQAIHARSLIPCQDTPDVKSTYTFNLRSPLPVVASGLATGAKDFLPGPDEQHPGTLLYSFHQAVPMPSYLFALASGDLASAAIGPRSTVWTGPEELLAAQWEFEEDTEKYIRIAEKLIYPYAWGTYNILVLPPSFPYGGMENPVNTFATPTVVSGDRQNVDVIAHELSHSWSGNLVSCASWEHFWLNEGWTTYMERRIQAEMHGGRNEFRDFSAMIGSTALAQSIDQFGKDHEFTKLIPDLKGKDPDDAFSSVPYEKGFTFLYYLEKLVTIEKWDKFIPHYFTTFKNKSLDSYEFKACLLDFFADDGPTSHALSRVDWDHWFYKPGYPDPIDLDTSRADQCTDLSMRWRGLNEAPESPDTSFVPSPHDIKHLSAQQSYLFLELVSSFDMRPELVDKMGEVYGYAGSKNVEITSRFYGLALKSKAEKFYPAAAELAGSVGRMKFVRPLYTELLKVAPELAKQTFEKNRDFYHPICRAMVEKILQGKERGG